MWAATMPLLYHDGVWGVRHRLTDIAEVAFASEGRTEAVLEVCAVFGNLRRKPLRSESKCSVVRQGEG
jgi:hypothetical protein